MLTQVDHPRARGEGANDVTALLPLHVSWGEEREHRPAILFTLDIKKVQKSTPAPPKVPLWYRGGRLLLDRDNHPMRDFSSTVPVTCSSAMEDWLIVAIFHSDSRIQIRDIHMRMPKETVWAKDKGSVPLFDANTISMRMTRFRLKAALLSRENRAGSETLEAAYKRKLGERCFIENSARSFGRDLTKEETGEIK